MSLLHRSCVQLEFRAAGGSPPWLDFMRLLRGSVQVVPWTPAALTTSPHIFTNPLPQPYNPHLSRILRSTGGVASAASSGCLVGRGSATFTCS